jgi:aspartate aminotransferase-like enzyme
MVHHETSTGVLNDLDHAAALCRARGTKLASDCVSSIGVVPVDLRHVFLASGVSGKAIGSLAGLSMVFHDGDVRSSPRAPRYLDLSLYADAEGVPFTQSSGLVSALRIATENTLRRRPFSDVRALSEWLRQQLRDMGFRLLAADAVSSPGIVTLVLESGDSAIELGDALARAGFALSYRSKYLRERNWIQIALMGECSRQKTELLLRAMRQLRVSAATRIVAEVG